jgi:hypothetical protein
LALELDADDVDFGGQPSDAKVPIILSGLFCLTRGLTPGNSNLTSAQPDGG